MPYINYDWNNPPAEFRIIYRICDKKMDTNLKGVSKSQCLANFIRAIKGHGAKLHFIADNCGKSTLDTLATWGFDYEVTNLGNSQSFKHALRLATTYANDDIVYMVEDDYMHSPDFIQLIEEGLEIADFVTLYDHADKYMDKGPNPFVMDGGEQTKVYNTESTHWKETNSTTMTFACKVKTLKEYKDVMLKYLDTDIPRDFEMWSEILKSAKLISSIPGHSTHCHSPWESPRFEVNK